MLPYTGHGTVRPDSFFQMFEVAEGAQGSIGSSHTFVPAHQDGVESLAVHGDVFYSGSRDFVIKKWDLSSKQLLQVRRRHWTVFVSCPTSVRMLGTNRPMPRPAVGQRADRLG